MSTDTPLLSTARELGMWLTDHHADHVDVGHGHECTCGWKYGEEDNAVWLQHYDRVLLQELLEVLPSGAKDLSGKTLSVAEAIQTGTCHQCCDTRE